MSYPGLAGDVSSGSARTRGTTRGKIVELIAQACEADDIDLISQAINTASSPGSSTSQELLMSMILVRVFSQNAPKVLEYILTHADAKGLESIYNSAAHHISQTAYQSEFPKALAQILLNHGWDINERSPGSQPLLWLIVNDDDAVAWCLERGASVLPKSQRPWPAYDINNAEAYAEYFERFPFTDDERSDCLYHCPPILELAASQSTVATFELFRSRGAPLSWRVLHKAANARASMWNPENTPGRQIAPGASPSDQGKYPPRSDKELARGRERREERMKMVRHLVDILKLDVNARDQPSGWRLGNFFGRPLHYIAFKNGLKGDCREVTWFLLERGADPELEEWGMTPMGCAKENGTFWEAVKEWKVMKTDDTAGGGDASENHP